MSKKKIVKRGKSKIKDNKIKSFLEKLKMSQQELADLCNTNRAHINKIVNNKNSEISLAMAFKICKALKQPVEQVFTLDKID